MNELELQHLLADAHLRLAQTQRQLARITMVRDEQKRQVAEYAAQLGLLEFGQEEDTIDLAQPLVEA